MYHSPLPLPPLTPCSSSAQPLAPPCSSLWLYEPPLVPLIAMHLSRLFFPIAPPERRATLLCHHPSSPSRNELGKLVRSNFAGSSKTNQFEIQNFPNFGKFVTKICKKYIICDEFLVIFLKKKHC
jgi:hypothetical protein